MDDGKKEMSILMPEPINITIGGKEFFVRKLSVRNQFKAAAIFEETPQSGVSDKEVMADRMIKIIALVTGLTCEQVDSFGTIDEVSKAFKAIWQQNGFDRFTAKPAENNQA